MYTLIFANPMLFLSTLSLRRATRKYLEDVAQRVDFYPRSPCGERHGPVLERCIVPGISIHALLAESDRVYLASQTFDIDISIHALLAESDLPSFLSGFWAYLFLSTLSLRRATPNHTGLINNQDNFYPRSPCGERRPT